ncbi:MAG: hydantoinase/oxoprolinase family protein [Deltaproteobacteria bacterium]|nr:hydantoinase/oxoprolinase family protein [Deltaproteobacteria bacterium]MBW2044339.1 hydantoinase/oxoprolinase family protein [Deltaproteobacteria bacterium]MBW2301276.1 hydantoinase/oxoprolinase family protein [Deltaproteobacteria bacterium]
MYILGVDIGGTFTDFVFIDENGEVKNFKAPTTPKDPSQGVMDGIRTAAKSFDRDLNSLLSDVLSVNHGCTVATNALITGKVAKIGLITTKGFRDTIIIQRCRKGSGVSGEFVPGESLYDLQMDRPRPLVPRSLIEEVTERINYEGRVLIPLNEGECKEKIRKLVEENQVEGIAVSLIWSPINPEHERRVLELIKTYPDVYKNSSCSSDLIPQIREYERTSTVVMNTCLKPLVKPYLMHLKNRLKAEGLSEEVQLLIMQLHGGVTDASMAAENPVVTIGSGPTGGVIGAQFIGSQMGIESLITLDMGGTSFDVGVIVDGEPLTAPISVVEGYHIMLPMVDVKSIGAGGGSVARVYKGTLEVGPQSAGAEPGPACYGKGGVESTITDADVVLGYIRGTLATNQIVLDIEAAHKAIKEHVADKLNMTVEEAAVGIVDLANSNISDAIRLSTIERGYDPTEFTAFVYGGAGPVHGAVLCRNMGIKKMIVPRFASTFSAFGVAASILKHTYIAIIGPELLTELNLDMVNQKLTEMTNEGIDTLRKEHVKSEDMQFRFYFEMRFEGQLNEITVELPVTKITTNDFNLILERFRKEYSLAYAYVPDFPPEVVTARVEASGRLFNIPLKSYHLSGSDASHAIKEKRKAYFDERKDFLYTNVYNGLKLMPGNIIEDHAIIEYPDTVIVVRPGQKAICDQFKNIVIDIMGEETWERK